MSLPPDGISDEPLPGVANLRTRFEQASPTVVAHPAATPPTRPKPRTRSSSISSTDLHVPVQPLRNSASSSDLKTVVKKAPPPPPPGRSIRALSPATGLSASNITATNESVPVEVVEPSQLSSGTVSSLRKQFGVNGSSPTVPPSPPPRVPPSPLQRPVPIPDVLKQRQKRDEDDGLQPGVAIRGSRLTTADVTPGHSRHSSTSSQISDVASRPVPKVKPVIPARSPNGPAITKSFIDTPSSFEDLAEGYSSTAYEPPISASFTRSGVPPIPPRRLLPDLAVGHDLSAIMSEPESLKSPKGPPPKPPPRRGINPGESTPVLQTPIPSTAPPPLPARRISVIPPSEQSTLSLERDLLLSPSGKPKNGLTSVLKPPPARIISLGDKLPPRRPTPQDDAEDDSDRSDAEEDGTPVKEVDQMPDSSRSSRRPPILYFHPRHTPKVAINAHNRATLSAGSILLVAGQHHLRMWDLMVSVDTPITSREVKSMCGKDSRITAMEWKACEFSGEALVVWMGTKDGHLIEMDVKSGVVGNVKYSAHGHAVSRIFRYGEAMVTVDSEGGKCLVFEKSARTGRVELLGETPRVVRIAENQDKMIMVDDKLITTCRAECVATSTHGHHGQPSQKSLKIPVLRYFDLFSNSPQRSLLPSEHVGPVTALGTVPAYPSTLFVGHESGYVSIWDLQCPQEGGIYPKCDAVFKIGPSDVLSMEGVNDRLWIGLRNGNISVYDVSERPWIVTNSWLAHKGPVHEIKVDVAGLVRDMKSGGGRLGVMSVGRESDLRMWDGLLEVDWIESELIKQESSFATFRELKVQIVSWNIDSARPDSLADDPVNINFLHNVLNATESPDIISFGFQEVVDLENRKMAAKNVLLGGVRRKAGGLSDEVLSEKITGAYKRWHDALVSAVRLAMPAETPYVVIHTESLVGLFTCIFVKKSERLAFKDLSINSIKRGMGGRYGNKGAILARFVIEDSSLCFINCHLAAGQHGVRSRNADIAAMLEAVAFRDVTQEPLAYVGGGDGTMVLDHEIVFFSGDMNYRIDSRREAIIAAVHAGELEGLHIHDQLLKEMRFNRGMRLRGFSEGLLEFDPTYKYDRRTDIYDTSEKRRSPAWCDRVLWRAAVPERVQQEHYTRYEANVSDHKPIAAAFTITVKKVRKDVAQQVRRQLENLWVEEQARLLQDTRSFYAQRRII